MLKVTNVTDYELNSQRQPETPENKSVINNNIPQTHPHHIHQAKQELRLSFR